MVLQFFIGIFVFFRYYFDELLDLIWGLYYTSLKKSVCELRNNLLLESAVSLAKKIRERNLSAEELVQAYIDRIKEINPILNGVVDDRFDLAIKEAQEIDKNIANGKYSEEDFKSKPFLGCYKN